jgi:hypothetical protein
MCPSNKVVINMQISCSDHYIQEIQTVQSYGINNAKIKCNMLCKQVSCTYR